MIRPSCGLLRIISVIRRFKFFANRSSRLDVNEFLSSTTVATLMTETSGSGCWTISTGFGFFVEKSTGSFWGGVGGFRTMVSSPLLIVAAVKGHFETRSRPMTAGAGIGSLKPGAGLGAAYGWNRSDSFLRFGSSYDLREATVLMGPGAAVS